MSDRPPFNRDAETKEELNASRTAEFLDIEIRGIKGHLGNPPLTPEEQALYREFHEVEKRVANCHVEGWENMPWRNG